MYEIFPIEALNDNYIWAIIHPAINKCIIVDPGDAAPVINFLEHRQLQIDSILITHHHWDHVDGLPTLIKRHTVKIYGPANDQIQCLDFRLTEGSKVVFDEFNLTFSILDVPGHTLGHITFYNDTIAFTGDTLFTGGCGKLFEGTAKQMYQSLEKLRQLPPSTHIYCGHEYTQANLKFAETVEPHNQALQQRIQLTTSRREQHLPTVPSTLALELETNPFLRCNEPSVVQAAERKAGKALTSPEEVFSVLREWKNHSAGIISR